MKKHGLLKILSILLLLVIIASYVLKGQQDTYAYIGLGDALLNSYQSLYYFFYIALFILSIGGFYGVLNKNQSYKKLLDNIVAKVKPAGKKFIYLIIIFFAIITSLTGMTLPLFIFIPFVTSIIILLGYDKLVAFSSTIISMMIGYIGGVFVTFTNPSTYQAVTYETFVGLEKKFDNLFPKLLLLFAGIALLIYFVNKHIKNVESKKVKYELNDNNEILVNEVKSDYTKIKTWPIIVILSLVFVIVTLGMIPWAQLFEITVFQEFHTWLTGLAIKDFTIIPNIISKSFPALGEWSSNGETLAYLLMSIILLVTSFIVALIGKIKNDDAIDGYVDGMKKMLPIAGLMMLSYTILICSYTNGFYNNIITNYGKFNYGISSLLAFLGCLLNMDTYYIIAGSFSPILNLITDESIYSSVAILFQGIYGIFNIIGPTSLILIFGLSYLDIPYTTYLKYIWRFILSIIILVAIVTLLVVLL